MPDNDEAYIEAYIKDGIVHFRPLGVMNADSFLELFNHVSQHPDFHPDLPRLWDLTQASAGDVGDPRDIVGRMRPQGKIAFVVSSDLGYGLARQASVWTESAGSVSRVFRGPSIEEAVAWLRE